MRLTTTSEFPKQGADTTGGLRAKRQASKRGMGIFELSLGVLQFTDNSRRRVSCASIRLQYALNEHVELSRGE